MQLEYLKGTDDAEMMENVNYQHERLNIIDWQKQEDSW